MTYNGMAVAIGSPDRYTYAGRKSEARSKRIAPARLDANIETVGKRIMRVIGNILAP
jgi:hypothetical protein